MPVKEGESDSLIGITEQNCINQYSKNAIQIGYKIQMIADRDV